MPIKRNSSLSFPIAANRVAHHLGDLHQTSAALPWNLVDRKRWYAVQADTQSRVFSPLHLNPARPNDEAAQERREQRRGHRGAVDCE